MSPVNNPIVEDRITIRPLSSFRKKFLLQVAVLWFVTKTTDDRAPFTMQSHNETTFPPIHSSTEPVHGSTRPNLGHTDGGQPENANGEGKRSCEFCTLRYPNHYKHSSMRHVVQLAKTRFVVDHELPSSNKKAPTQSSLSLETFCFRFLFLPSLNIFILSIS